MQPSHGVETYEKVRAIRKGGFAVLAADYPFLDILWTMLIFFAWVIWFWLLITVFIDIFRRRDTSGCRQGALDASS